VSADPVQPAGPAEIDEVDHLRIERDGLKVERDELKDLLYAARRNSRISANGPSESGPITSSMPRWRWSASCFLSSTISSAP